MIRFTINSGKVSQSTWKVLSQQTRTNVLLTRCQAVKALAVAGPSCTCDYCSPSSATATSTTSSSNIIATRPQHRFKSTVAAMADAPLPSYLPTSTPAPSALDDFMEHDDDMMLDDPVPSIPTTHWTTRVQPNTMEYTGGVQIPVTSTLQLVTPQDDIPRGTWPVFRMMDEDGSFRNPQLDGPEDATMPVKKDTRQSSALFAGAAFHAHVTSKYPQYQHELQESFLLKPAEEARHSYAGLDEEDERKLPLLLRAHKQMVRLREMDRILLNAQRQGRISFYMTCTGEEAIHMGSASALDLQDQVFTQYREQGVIMWRGFSLEQFTNQCFSNDLDLGKGRQMPVHYGSRALNFHTVSSPLGTQIPQAAGAAYRLKMAKKDNVVVCYFGDGCASTTDFHSGLNFAATLKAPVIFLCRNNGYAISTPITDQYAGDGIVGRAPGYGMAAIRVDGNDIFAMHAATRKAREYALEHSAPVLIEAMTYRQGHHSTSDDSTRYRDVSEVQRFTENHDPLSRLECFLMEHGWLTDEEVERMQENEKLAVLQAMEKAEKRSPPDVSQLFTDVYAEVPPHLLAQERELHAHMAKYPERYQAGGH